LTSLYENGPSSTQTDYTGEDLLQTHNNNFSRGYVIALTATVLWSSTGPLISYLSKNYALPSLVLAFWRDLFVSLGMLLGLAVFSRARFRLHRSHWKFMILYGLTLAVFNSMWTFSVQYNGAAVATVLAFSSPAMTAILSRLVFKEQFNRVKMISILLSLIGTVLVSGAHDPSVWKLNPAGIIFGLLTGLFFAIYNLEGKAASDRHIDSWTALLYSFGMASIFLLSFNLGFNSLAGKAPLNNLLWLGSSLSGWGILFFLGVAPTLGGFGLYTLSLR
jgi:drug/metabolite transporter (DMT)-like permease